MTAFEQFNRQGEAEAESALLACCGSRAWAAGLVRLRDEDLTHDGRFSSPEALIRTGSRLWFTLPEPDWLEAFCCHPRIGEVKAPASTFLAHSGAEQSAAQATLADVAAQLLDGNRAYEAKFGFRYIVFASGRTAPELLAVLQQRLGNTRAQELEEAARQQDRITCLRMERWLAL